MRTEIRGKGDPIQLDYRLEKAGDGWKIYDVNVLGVWLVENYRNSFAQEIGANGIDGLIAKLAERNKSAAARARRADAAAAGDAHVARGARHAAHADAGAAERRQRGAGGRRGRRRCSSSTPRRWRCCSRVERLAARLGRAFAVRGVPAKLAALAKLYGVDVLLLKPEAACRRGRRRSAQAGDVVGDAP